jgi:hypothetical protein
MRTAHVEKVAVTSLLLGMWLSNWVHFVDIGYAVGSHGKMFVLAGMCTPQKQRQQQ